MALEALEEASVAALAVAGQAAALEFEAVLRVSDADRQDA